MLLLIRAVPYRVDVASRERYCLDRSGPLPELEKHKTVVVRPLSTDASKISSRSTEIVTTFLEDPCGHFVLDGLRLDLKTIKYSSSIVRYSSGVRASFGSNWALSSSLFAVLSRILNPLIALGYPCYRSPKPKNMVFQGHGLET